MNGELLNARALITTVHERAVSQDPLVLLESAVAVAAGTGEAADAMVEHYVAAARAAGLSWTAIGEQLGVSKQAARQRFSHRLDQPEISRDIEGVAMTPRLTACLQVAQDAADADDSAPSTQHLLLGLLHVGFAASVLDQLGVTREKLREANARLFEPTGDGSPGSPRVTGDGEAETAVTNACRMALRRGQNEVRTEHLLFVLATDPGCSARRVLDHLGVEVARVKKLLSDMIPPPRRRGKGRCDVRACSFCGCTDSSRPMVPGPGLWICTNCVTLATNILMTRDERRQRTTE